jgi:hypothetical protein
MKKQILATLLILAILLPGCSAQAASSTSVQSASSEDAVSSATTHSSEGSSGAGEESTGDPDAVSSASLYFYESSSLTGEDLRQAIRDAQGCCSVATVNSDGTPNLANFVPYPAGEDHLAFTFSDNVTKANLARGEEGMVSYYIYDKDAETKEARNQGARFRVELETDQAVIDQLLADDPTIPAAATFVRILEVLPLG